MKPRTRKSAATDSGLRKQNRLLFEKLIDAFLAFDYSALSKGILQGRELNKDRRQSASTRALRDRQIAHLTPLVLKINELDEKEPGGLTVARVLNACATDGFIYKSSTVRRYLKLFGSLKPDRRGRPPVR